MNERSAGARTGWLSRWRPGRAPARSRIGIVVDSASCLPEEFSHAPDLIELTIPIIVDDEVQDGDTQALLMGLAMGKAVRTSRPAPGQFVSAYTRLQEAGCKEIVSVHLSGALSGTFEAARLAASQVTIPVHVIDTRTAAAPIGFAVAEMARARAAGADVEQLLSMARQAEKYAVYFAVPSLETLRRGGRISAVSGVLGTLLNVKPILGINEGSIVALEKPRSFERAQGRLVTLARTRAAACQGPVRIGVMHFGAAELAQEVAAELSDIGKEAVLVQSLPAVLAAHTGIGVLAICVAGLPAEEEPSSEAN